MKKLFIIICLFSFASALLAQDNPEKQNKKETRKQEKQKKINDLVRQDEEGILVYSKQSLFGFQLRTNGYGFFYEKGKMKTQRNTMVYSLEFNEIKHPKKSF